MTIDGKIDVDAIIGPVLGLVQGEIAPTASTSYASHGGTCWQHQPRVLQLERRVNCAKCGVALDPFDVLVSIARDHDRQKYYAAEHRRRMTELDEMKAEEKRVKARTKAASRKDAQTAVDAERARTLAARRKCIEKLNDARRIHDEMRRLLGREFDE